MYDLIEDEANNKRDLQKRWIGIVCFEMLWMILMAVGYAQKMKGLCTAAMIVCVCSMIFWYDLFMKPALQYKRFLMEIRKGMSRKTVGLLAKIEDEPIHEDGLLFREVIINVGKDGCEEGERRFLLDMHKQAPEELRQRMVEVTCQGTFILDIQPVNETP